MGNKGESKFDLMIRLLWQIIAENQKLRKQIAAMDRKVKRQSYQFTLIILLFLVIILGTIIVVTG